MDFTLTRDLSWSSIAAALFTVYALYRAHIVVQGFKASRHIPRIHCLFSPLGLPGVILPTTWWNPGIAWIWKWRLHTYSSRNTETVCYVPWLAGVPVVYNTNLDVVRQTCFGGHRSAWIKPIESSVAVLRWGMNLFAAEGEVWRRHRRVMGPAFNNDLYDLVWSESQKTLQEMMHYEGWVGKNTVDVPVLQDLSVKFALIIIGRCGFGFDFNWAEPLAATQEGQDQLEAPDMPIHKALQVISETFLAAALLPKWLLALPFKRFKEIGEAQRQLEHFMNAQVAERKSELGSGSARGQQRRDAFTMLVRANGGENEKLQLTDQELIGNIFIMLFAGHETTANTLATTLGFLSLHDDIQEEVYQQIMSVVGNSREPEMGDFSKLDKVAAIFYEALRLFPAGTLMMRSPVEDTILQIPKTVGEGVDLVPVAKGVWVCTDLIGVQYNPRYFDNPTEYRPSRWYGFTGEGDLLSAFSIGPRTCIGRKFAIVEAVSFLATLLREWRVEPLLLEGETREEWSKRAMEGKLAMALGSNDIPLRFIRRKH